MDWYYSEGNDRRGPVSDEEFGELTRSGKIDASTLVWREGWDSWRKLSEANVAGVAISEGTAFCVQCGKVFPTTEMVQYEGSWVCAGCKPLFFQKIKEGVTIARDMAFAGFWLRFVAYLLDAIILQIVNLPLRFLLASTDPNIQLRMIFLVSGISMAIGAAYEIFFVGKFGASPGKMALRLRVVTPDGGKVSYARATGRYFSKILSGIILCIGYLMVAFDEEKRGLHDRICDTRVIRLNA